MIKQRHLYYVLLSSVTLATADCKKAYEPPVVSDGNSYLVVEGIINSGADSTFIKLSKTVKISGNVNLNYVSSATVTVEDEQGNSHKLAHVAKGVYAAPALGLDASKKYRLHIKIDSKDYASDYVEVKQTPPIDSIGFSIKKDGLQIYANTHDDTNNTRYYRWDYTETWHFNTRYQSSYIVDKNLQEVRPRTKDEEAYRCFASDTSSTIVIASSAKLAQDVIAQAPITTIPSSSEKVELRYTIKIKQYALTKDAYQFWEDLKKNTEQLGSVFDAQPTQLTGNIHNTANAKEPVLGYVSVSSTQQKRVFIDYTQLPKTWITHYPYDCDIFPNSAYFVDPKTSQNDVQSNIIDGGGIPVQAIYEMGGNIIIGYTYGSEGCTDCRIRGRNVAPNFWIEKK